MAASSVPVADEAGIWAMLGIVLLTAVVAVVGSDPYGPVQALVGGLLFISLELWLAAIAWTLLSRA